MLIGCRPAPKVSPRLTDRHRCGSDVLLGVKPAMHAAFGRLYEPSHTSKCRSPLKSVSDVRRRNPCAETALGKRDDASTQTSSPRYVDTALAKSSLSRPHSYHRFALTEEHQVAAGRPIM
jgi:hypothetical protein